MKLDDAVKLGAEAVAQLKGPHAVAVHSLVELAKKVGRSRRAIKELSDAIAPEAHVNQETLFGTEDVAKEEV